MIIVIDNDDDVDMIASLNKISSMCYRRTSYPPYPMLPIPSLV